MRLTTFLGLSLAAAPAAVFAQAGAGSSDASADEDRGRQGVEIVGHVLKPMPLEWSAERMSRLALPEGFAIDVFAKGLKDARMMDVADDGTLYLTRRAQGDVMMLRDTTGDGTADVQQVVAEKADLHGIEIDGDTVYLMTVEHVYKAQRRDDGTLGELALIADGFPGGRSASQSHGSEGPGRPFVCLGGFDLQCMRRDR